MQRPIARSAVVLGVAAILGAVALVLWPVRASDFTPVGIADRTSAAKQSVACGSMLRPRTHSRSTIATSGDDREIAASMREAACRSEREDWRASALFLLGAGVVGVMLGLVGASLRTTR